ncbi:MmcQ/YjbR family DNA-binding protein [Zavarzinia sp. CC-PAN008]|uniref:MmcQ/YjbR family DNA-binding protein n=1 Tax=Zavarzinia sp. CC-PAN008 TaxID=3243332 RepID=UPI003F746C12
MSETMAQSPAWAKVRSAAQGLFGVEEGTSYGTPALRAGKAFLARLREDGTTLAAKVGFAERDLYLAAEPDVFFTTPHYEGYPMVLVRLDVVEPQTLRAVLIAAWRAQAPRRLVKAWEAGG